MILAETILVSLLVVGVMAVGQGLCRSGWLIVKVSCNGGPAVALSKTAQLECAGIPVVSVREVQMDGGHTLLTLVFKCKGDGRMSDAVASIREHFPSATIAFSRATDHWSA